MLNIPGHNGNANQNHVKVTSLRMATIKNISSLDK
jgi:hypothetical protein